MFLSDALTFQRKAPNWSLKNKKTIAMSDHCLECGKEIHGRIDKKFCSMECKNRYNNRRTFHIRHIKTRIIGALNNNYEILNSLLREELTSAEISDLVDLGFNPSYVTGHHKGRKAHDEYKCFDIKYDQTPSRIINIRKQEKVKSKR